MVVVTENKEIIAREIVLCSLEHRLTCAIEELDCAVWHAEHIKDNRAVHLVRIKGNLVGLLASVRKEIEVVGK